MSQEAQDDAVAVPDELTNALAEAAMALDPQAQEAALAAEAERIENEAQKTAHDLLFVKGLYTSIALTGPIGEAVERYIRAGGFAFDEYCTTCKRETTFRVGSGAVESRGATYRHGSSPPAPPRLFSIRATCQRDFAVYSYVVKIGDERATKIGQYPSMADLAFGELRTIDKSLDLIDRRELGKALGLHAHDTAIGAFVYLRRVFERMVQRAHERQSASGHAIDGFDGMKMDQRIAALKDELPEKVVQNSAVFSVLSVGLHELTEEQCAQYFPVMKAVLFQMLEQEEHKRKAEITARETDAALQSILGDLGSGQGAK